MKKIISIILSFVIFITCFTSINMSNVIAYSDDVTIIDDVDWSEAGFSNVQIIYRNNQENANVSLYLLNRPSIEIDYIIDETGDAVHFERIGDIGYIYINEDLLTTIEFDEQQMTRASVNIPDNIRTYDGPDEPGFSDFYYVKQTSWKINEFGKMFLNSQANSMILTALYNAIIAAAIPFSPIALIAANITVAAGRMYSKISTYPSIQSILTNDALNGVDIMYKSFNNQCDILAWYGMSSYATDGSTALASITTEFIPNQNHSWDGHPYDYSQPAACRVLVNTYP